MRPAIAPTWPYRRCHTGGAIPAVPYRPCTTTLSGRRDQPCRLASGCFFLEIERVYPLVCVGRNCRQKGGPAPWTGPARCPSHQWGNSQAIHFDDPSATGLNGDSIPKRTARQSTVGCAVHFENENVFSPNSPTMGRKCRGFRLGWLGSAQK